LKNTSSPEPLAFAMTTAIKLDGKSLTVEQVNAIAHGCKITTPNDCLERMARSNAIVLRAVESCTPIARSIEPA